jgi:hypothetical protein
MGWGVSWEEEVLLLLYLEGQLPPFVLVVGRRYRQRNWRLVPPPCQTAIGQSTAISFGGCSNHLAAGSRALRPRHYRRFKRRLQDLPPCETTAGSCRQLNWRFDATFHKVWNDYLFSENHRKLNIKKKKVYWWYLNSWSRPRMLPHLQNQKQVAPQLLKPDTGGPRVGFRAEEYLGPLSGFWWFNDTHLSSKWFI